MKKQFFVGIIILVSLLVAVFLRSPYIIHVINLAYIQCVLTLGFLVCFVTGRLHFGMAGFWAIGSYTSALLSVNLHWPFWFCLPVAGIVSALIGVAIGRFVLSRGPSSFILLTWAFAEVIRLTAVNARELLGGASGISGIPLPRIIYPGGCIEFTSRESFYYLFLLILILAIIFLYRLYNSQVGRALRAVGQNEFLAESLGMNVLKYRLIGFTICCFFAGIAGSMYAHYITYICPSCFTIWQSLAIEIFAIVGGLNNFIAGPVLGPLFMTIVPEIFRSHYLWVPVIYGAIGILVILLMPKGLASLGRIFLSLVESRVKGKGA